MNEVNEPTASTLQSNNIILYFFSAPLKGWVGAVVLRVGSVAIEARLQQRGKMRLGACTSDCFALCFLLCWLFYIIDLWDFLRLGGCTSSWEKYHKKLLC